MMNPKYIKVFNIEHSEENYSIQKFDTELICEYCGTNGSYYLVNEKHKIGSCLSCLQPLKHLGIDNYYKVLEN